LAPCVERLVVQSPQVIDKCGGFDCGCSCNSSLLNDHGVRSSLVVPADIARRQGIRRSARLAEEVESAGSVSSLMHSCLGRSFPFLSLTLSAACLLSFLLVCSAGSRHARQADEMKESSMCEVPAQGAYMMGMRYQ